MKKGKSILTRCLALALALVLIVSSANLSAALKVSANSQSVEVSYGKLMADTYELADWEKELLSSGLLDLHFTYESAPTADDKVVTIDDGNSKIIAKAHNEWIPVSADIMVNNEAVETVPLTDGEGTYTYTGEEFSVAVKYELYANLKASTQQVILNSGVYLNEGLENLATVYAQDTNLMIVEEALGMLMSIKDLSPDGSTTFSDGFRAAVEALNAEKTEGGLKLRGLNATYAEGTSYLWNNWTAYMDCTKTTYEHLLAIHTDSLVQGGGVEQYLETTDILDGTSNAPLWRTFKSAVKELVEALEPVANDAWNMGQIFVITPGAELDALLKNVGTPSKVNFVEDLLVDTATVLATKNMQTVIASVELKVVEDEVGSAELVSGGASKRVVLSVRQNASEEEIYAEIEKSGVVAQAQAAWGEVFVAEHYEATTVQSEVNGNIVVTITYAPKNYNLNCGFEDGETSVKVPYGYQYMLPVHENASQYSYDYTVEGEAAMQGEVITITGNTNVTRTEGRAYTATTLYSVIGESMGDWNQYEVLSSGALKGDSAIYYRVPAAPEMTLSEKVLTVEAAIASDYAGLSWVPYTYSNANDGTNYFAGNNVVSGYNQRQAQVNYILRLTNVDAAKAAAMLELANTIDAEEEMQTAGMEFLLNYYNDIGTLNKGYLEGLISIIKNFDFTPGDGANGFNNYDDAKNKELIAYFNGIIGKIVAKDGGYIDSKDNNLMLYTMLTEYKNGGLAYYYKNSAEIYRQVSDLGSFLNQLIADEEYQAALALLLEDQGMPEYIEKISKLGQALTDTKENLLPTNEMIDTTKDLKALVAAVSDDGASANPNATDVPAIISETYTVVDESAVVLIANVNVDGVQVAQVTTKEYDRWAKLDSAMIAELQAKIDEVVSQLGEKLPYYTVSGGAQDLAGKVGVEMEDNLTVTVNCNAKQYRVVIEGEADQYVSINDLTVDLPQHKDHPKTVYVYSVGLTGYETTYTFTKDHLDGWGDSAYHITRESLDLATQQLNAALEALNNNTAGNTYEIVDGTLVANVAGTADGMMAFATGLLSTGYGYIGVNGEPMLYSVEGEGLEISLQTLIDAILADKSFGSQTLIDLGNNNGGKVLTATMQLGIDEEVLYEEAMPFVLNLTSVPEQMGTVANGLDAVKNNMYFKSNGDHVFVYLDLPEKVYEVYLTAMWGIGELDKTDINAINNAIAFYFLYDYIELVANTDVTAQTFENTLRIFDEAANAVLDKDIPDYDIAAYDKYLELVKKILNSEGIEVAADETTMSLSLSGQGKHLLTVADKLGMNLDAYRTELGMVKEFKEGETLSVKAVATLVNTAVDYEALVIDINAGIDGAKEIYHVDNRSEALNEAIDLGKGLGLANSIDYTTDLPTRASQITGKAAIMLLDDVDGDLVFNDTTILDLNGKTINGNLIANGHVYIMDSTLDTANAGSITGSVSGNVTIVAGNYNANVAAYLPDGYLQVNGNVRNAMYTIESPNSGDLIVTVNPDFYMEGYVNGYFPSAKALAADIATDLAFNYYLAAKLAVDGNTIYNMDLDNLIGFIESETRVSDFINQILTLVDTEGTSNVINTITADLLDFAAIEQALINGTEIVSYDVTVAPYGAELVHIVDGDYVSFNLGSMEGHERTFEIALKMEEGVNTDRLIKVVGELADIVVAENTYATVFVKQPTYSDRTLWLDGNTKASLDLDLSKNPDYQIIIAVALAYGNPDKAEALVNAIGDQTALKKVFNTITVEEVFNALKALEREVGFAAMAESLGVDEAVENAAAKERVVHLTLSSIGYVLEKLDITGYPDKTMGMIEEGDTGRYTVSRSAAKAGDVTRRGFTVDASAVVEHVTLSVKIFEDDCLWGDADHDGVVDQHDASLVLQYFLGNLDENEFFCTKRTDVDANGVIDQHDASLILEYFLGYIDKFPAEV